MRYLLDTNVCVVYLNGRSILIVCGQMRARLAIAGTPIGAYDLQIAAIALANNLILITHNTREFNRVNGLQVEDREVEA